VNGVFSATRTNTNTYTDARLWAVLPEVGADFHALASAGLISSDVARRWTEELGFVLQHQAAFGFQVQLTCPGRSPIALDYRVSSDGSIQESSAAGGIDYYALPLGTRAGLFVDLNFSARNYGVVQRFTQQRGWGTDGQAVQGDSVRDRAYSKEGYGVIRGRIGTWP
jgi:Bacterial HORMA domain family 1